MKKWLCLASNKYLPQSLVLQDSVQMYMPEHEFILRRGDWTSFSPQFVQDRFQECLDLLCGGVDEVIISGSDYVVFSPLQLDDVGYGYFPALFVPHFLSWNGDVARMRAGVINSDFQVWRNDSSVIRFLEGMIEMLSQPKELRSDFEYEQLWLPFALAQCDGQIIADPGFGVAYYNFFERGLTINNPDDGFDVMSYHSGDRPLKTFHFSGWDSNNPAQLTRHKMDREMNSDESTLLKWYAIEVEKKKKENYV